MKRFSVLLMLIIVILGTACQTTGDGRASEDGSRIPIKVLILPKFEPGEMAGDFPGEAQFYYEGYLAGGDEYEITGGYEGHKLYVRDGIALYVTGAGKVNAGISTLAVLSDNRFDFSGAYIISTGCCGSAEGYTVMGDVFIASAAVDQDLGHSADPRDMENPDRPTWFHDNVYDKSAYVILNQDFIGRVYDLVKDVRLETTEKTRAYMSASFDGAEWAVRDPMVMKGTTASSDNYWKGRYDEAVARLVVETYGCPDPYVCSEMEDVAIGVVLKRLGMLDRYIIIRGSVNMDVYMKGTSPESLWLVGSAAELESEDSQEAADLFPVAMENNFKVGKVVIDAILRGQI